MPEKAQRRRFLNDAALGRVAEEEFQPFQVFGVEKEVDVVGEVGRDLRLAKADARTPAARDLRDVRRLDAVIARVAEDGGDVERAADFAQGL